MMVMEVDSIANGMGEMIIVTDLEMIMKIWERQQIRHVVFVEVG